MADSLTMIQAQSYTALLCSVVLAALQSSAAQDNPEEAERAAFEGKFQFVKAEKAVGDFIDAGTLSMLAGAAKAQGLTIFAIRSPDPILAQFFPPGLIGIARTAALPQLIELVSNQVAEYRVGLREAIAEALAAEGDDYDDDDILGETNEPVAAGLKPLAEQPEPPNALRPLPTPEVITQPPAAPGLRPIEEA